MATYSPTPQWREIPLAPTRAALLFVDVQNYNCSQQGTLYKYFANHGNLQEQEYFYNRVQEITPNWVKLQAMCRNAGIEVMYTVIQQATKDGRDRGLDYKISGFSVPPGSLDAKVIDAIKPAADEIIIPKTSSSVFMSTNMDYVLRAMEKKFLIIVGCLTDQCVAHAVMDACDLGYYVTVVPECCATQTEARHESALAAFSGYCRQRTLDQLAEELGQSKAPLQAPSLLAPPRGRVIPSADAALIPVSSMQHHHPSQSQQLLQQQLNHLSQPSHLLTENHEGVEGNRQQQPSQSEQPGAYDSGIQQEHMLAGHQTQQQQLQQQQAVEHAQQQLEHSQQHPQSVIDTAALTASLQQQLQAVLMPAAAAAVQQQLQVAELQLVPHAMSGTTEEALASILAAAGALAGTPLHALHTEAMPGHAAEAVSQPPKPAKKRKSQAKAPTPPTETAPQDVPTASAEVTVGDASGSPSGPASKRERKMYFEYAKASWELDDEFRLQTGVSWVEVPELGDKDKGLRGLVFCKLCRSAGKDNQMTRGYRGGKRSALREHMTTKDHKDLVDMLNRNLEAPAGPMAAINMAAMLAAPGGLVSMDAATAAAVNAAHAAHAASALANMGAASHSHSLSPTGHAMGTEAQTVSLHTAPHAVSPAPQGVHSLAGLTGTSHAATAAAHIPNTLTALHVSSSTHADGSTPDAAPNTLTGLAGVALMPNAALSMAMMHHLGQPVPMDLSLSGHAHPASLGISMVNQAPETSAGLPSHVSVSLGHPALPIPLPALPMPLPDAHTAEQHASQTTHVHSTAADMEMGSAHTGMQPDAEDAAPSAQHIGNASDTEALATDAQMQQVGSIDSGHGHGDTIPQEA